MLAVKAFTLLESLLVLVVTSTLLLLLSGTITSSFQTVEEHLFFLDFEHVYSESQKQSLAAYQPLELSINEKEISNGVSKIRLPKGISTSPQTLTFDKGGGNSSLGKIIFRTRTKTVAYQLYMGNGKFKKTEN
ncbi:competence type IV pilus minor pilin ComGD [Streptococcus massiliensis]|nr:competence type IV pilus minor pilin ComGD [Streptococcus massiliensis]